MKRWKPNKSYVYYLPESDQIYIARYQPENMPWTSVLQFSDIAFHEQNFNPDIFLPYFLPSGEFNEKFEKAVTVYLGEL